MKTCPTCHTNVFDDMRVCYSCLFRFNDADDLDTDFLEVDDPPATHPSMAPEPIPLPSHAKSPKPASRATAQTHDSPSAAKQSPPPTHNHPEPKQNDWVIRLEIRNTDNPQQIWSMELNPANWPTPEAA